MQEVSNSPAAMSRSSPPSFFRLPRELRDTIYGYCLIGCSEHDYKIKEVVSEHPNLESILGDRQHEGPLRTNKQFRAEYLEAAWKNCTTVKSFCAESIKRVGYLSLRSMGLIHPFQNLYHLGSLVRMAGPGNTLRRVELEVHINSVHSVIPPTRELFQNPPQKTIDLFLLYQQVPKLEQLTLRFVFAVGLLSDKKMERMMDIRATGIINDSLELRKIIMFSDCAPRSHSAYQSRSLPEVRHRIDKFDKGTGRWDRVSNVERDPMFWQVSYFPLWRFGILLTKESCRVWLKNTVWLENATPDDWTETDMSYTKSY